MLHGSGLYLAQCKPHYCQKQVQTRLIDTAFSRLLDQGGLIAFLMAFMQGHYDIIIVGAGIHGLCAAHTLLSINASLKLLIIDEKSSIGGVWAKEQPYPGLRANNLQGYYEFSDFQMLAAGLGHLNVRPRGVISGEAIHGYLFEYAEHFDLLHRVQLDTRVVRATNHEANSIHAWSLQLAGSCQSAGFEDRFVTCFKLIVATGQHSQPFVPFIPGKDQRARPCIHSSELGKQGKPLISNPSNAHVTVIGGSKSAHDAAHMFAMAGKKMT